MRSAIATPSYSETNFSCKKTKAGHEHPAFLAALYWRLITSPWFAPAGTWWTNSIASVTVHDFEESDGNLLQRNAPIVERSCTVSASMSIATPMSELRPSTRTELFPRHNATASVLQDQSRSVFFPGYSYYFFGNSEYDLTRNDYTFSAKLGYD